MNAFEIFAAILRCDAEKEKHFNNITQRDMILSENVCWSEINEKIFQRMRTSTTMTAVKRERVGAEEESDEK